MFNLRGQLRVCLQLRLLLFCPLIRSAVRHGQPSTTSTRGDSPSLSSTRPTWPLRLQPDSSMPGAHSSQEDILLEDDLGLVNCE